MQPNIAYFKFFNELNDFLPDKKKNHIYSYEFSGNPSVKDAIEAIGIPHTEIDLIFIDKSSVDFAYSLNSNDTFDVYPINSGKDGIHLTNLISDFRFIIDVHLGKLAKYLRMLGFDSLYDNNFTDNLIITKSLEEYRIILTRDLGILKNGKTKLGYFIRNQEVKKQLLETLIHFNIYGLIRPFTRCTVCNGGLMLIKKNKIENQLEPLTKEYYNEFYQCKNCKKIFWKGSHYEKMKTFIEELKSYNS